jgi:hypothetical protein
LVTRRRGGAEALRRGQNIGLSFPRKREPRSVERQEIARGSVRSFQFDASWSPLSRG